MIGNLTKYMCAKIYQNRAGLTKLLQKQNGIVFLPHIVHSEP